MVRAGEEFAGYVIERRLGGGGMGEVYLARHPRLPRLVAIKLLARELAAEQQTRARFQREAELVARLDHPNIVTVHDRGVEDGRLWIAMQYVDGGDASALHPLTLAAEDAVRIIAETARALDYAHSMGVIHRDVKPANILLAREVPGHDQRILLTDFGIGRLRDDSVQLTQTGMLAATLTYASPEQLSGEALDQRSDQYSLACTLFRLLTGVTPFHADTAAAVIAGHLQQPAPRATDRRPELPAALDAVFARGLAKHPGDRFDSCRAFAEAAAQAFSATPVATLPPTRPMTDAGQRASAATVVTSRPQDLAAADTMVLPVLRDATPPDFSAPEPPSPAPSNSAARRRYGGWATAGAGALVLAIAVAVGIVWLTRDSGRQSKDTPPIASGSHAAVYPGYIPFMQIDVNGNPVTAPVPVHDPANDGRLPCKPVSIAAALPLSGKDAALGNNVLGGVKLAVSQFVQGGRNACPVTVREFDTEGDPDRAAQVAQRIAEDESVLAVIGPALSGEVMAAGGTLDASGLSFLAPVATNPLLAQSGWSGFFRGLANDNIQGPALGRYLAGNAGYSRVCVVRDGGGGYAATLADAVTAGLGAAATCAASVDPDGDPSAAVAGIVAARPDAVFYSGYQPSSAKLLTKLRNAGVTAPFILGDGSYDQSFRTEAGAAAAGTLVACACGPVTDRFHTEFRTATGAAPTLHAVEAYDLTAILLRGIVSGHTTRIDLRAYLHNYRGDGIAHSYAWSSIGELGDPRLWLYRLG